MKNERLAYQKWIQASQKWIEAQLAKMMAMLKNQNKWLDDPASATNLEFAIKVAMATDEGKSVTDLSTNIQESTTEILELKSAITKVQQ